MTKHELQLCAALLELAAEEFSNHGCNDFNLAAHVPIPDERFRLIRDADDEFGGGEMTEEEIQEEVDRGVSDDWVLMNWMAEMLRREADLK